MAMPEVVLLMRLRRSGTGSEARVRAFACVRASIPSPSSTCAPEPTYLPSQLGSITQQKKASQTVL
jgi:hypothetical protein